MTDVATSLPQLDLLPKTTITVTLSDPGAKITSMIVHGLQGIQGEVTFAALPPLLAYAPPGDPGGG
jgi:hypothetical protein